MLPSSMCNECESVSILMSMSVFSLVSVVSSLLVASCDSARV